MPWRIQELSTGRRRHSRGNRAARKYIRNKTPPARHFHLPACPSSQQLSNIERQDRKSTRLNSSHTVISYAVFCLKKKRFNMESMVQRDPVFAIVNEVYSILIDEARTPLIISGPS